MEKIFEKIGTYNLFNYFFPGVIFTYLLNSMVKYNLIQSDIIMGLFLYYFIGMIISRIGSLLIEPALKRLLIIEFSSYKDYADSSKKDDKIQLLVEVTNTYRTIIAIPITITIVWVYKILQVYLNFRHEIGWVTLMVMLVIIFSVSYKKQSEYVKKRVEANK